MRLTILLAGLALFACSPPEASRSHDSTPAAASQPDKPKPPGVAGPKLEPVDDATREPSLVKFRADLLAAVRKHDVSAVMATVDPKIRTSFGSGGGAKEFRRLLEQPNSRIWPELERILTLGGT